MEIQNAIALSVAALVTGVFLGWRIKQDTDGKIDFLVDLNLKTLKKLKEMPTKAEFQAAFAEVNDALNNIGDDITRLTDQLANGDLNDAEEAEVLAELQALGARAKEIAGRTAEGGTEEPPVEPPVEPTV